MSHGMEGHSFQFIEKRRTNNSKNVCKSNILKNKIWHTTYIHSTIGEFLGQKSKGEYHLHGILCWRRYFPTYLPSTMNLFSKNFKIQNKPNLCDFLIIRLNSPWRHVCERNILLWTYLMDRKNKTNVYELPKLNVHIRYIVIHMSIKRGQGRGKGLRV